MHWTVGRVTFMEGERLEGVVIHCGDGFFYHRHHDRPDSPTISLRCMRRKRQTNPCWGTAVMSRDGQHFQCTRQHTHGPDPWLVEDRYLRQNVMAAVASGDPAPYSVIIRNVGLRGRFSLDARARMTVARMRTAMRDERLRYFPPVPATLFHLGMDLSQPEYFHVTATIDGQDNIFAGTCGDFAAGTLSIVFMSRRLSYHLQSASQVFADGTFKKRPRKPLSNQIFVISTVWYNEHTSSKHIVTCARILMQRRTAEAYIILFEYLKTLMPYWNPQIIMCDHELGQVLAWMHAFPHARITSCLFHYSVDVFRNARRIGLEDLMKQSWVADTTVRCCSVLALLPPQCIEMGLVAIGHWARYMGAMQNPLIRDFFAYMHRQWIPAVAYLSVFGVEDRTNNVSESVNASLGLEIREDRPNVYYLIGGFKRLEDQAMLDLHALQRGLPAGRIQQLKTLRNDARILNLTDSFIRGNINIVNFLMEASSSLVAPYVQVFG